jgi:hypothetical protein
MKIKWPRWLLLSLAPEDLICFRSETKFAMFMSEVDSFIWKFRKLLHTGKNACLEIKSEGGKAFVNLSAEVEIPHNSKPHSQSRNGPARQRRCERRAAARAEVAAEDAAAQTEEAVEAESVKTKDVADTFKDAVEATELEAARAFEPSDEFSNLNVSDEISEKLATAVSIIPVRRVGGNDDSIEKVIKDKFAQKSVRILEISIHRSVNGIFIRSDARIEPTIGKFLDETDFGFVNCRVIPIFASELDFTIQSYPDGSLSLKNYN